MATDIKEVLSRFVPAKDLEEAVEAIRDTDIAPEWFRQEAAKLGADAKEAAALRARLESIESAPKRKEALKRVGIDYDAVPKYGQKALDDLPVEDLEDLTKVAQYVQEQGFEANLQTEDEARDKSGAESITDFTSSAGEGTPVRTSQQSKDEEFHRELEAAPDKEAARAVLAKHGRLATDNQ